MPAIARYATCVIACVALLAGVAPTTSAGVTTHGPSRSARAELETKRYVAAGDRAYVIGTQDGRFPPIGWHIKGEMGGVWAHPIKLLDGYWFSINGKWMPPASKFTSGAGYARMSFPKVSNVKMRRTEFSPDGVPVVLVGLDITNRGRKTKNIDLQMAARTELMAAYPWGETKPNAREFNRRDIVSVSGDGVVKIREKDRDWRAFLSSSRSVDEIRTGRGFWGSSSKREKKAHSVFGKGAGVGMKWNLRLAAGASETLWVGVSGSHVSGSAAKGALTASLTDAQALLDEKIASRRALLDRTNVTLPDKSLQRAFKWGKLNMADLAREVTDMKIRDVDIGERYGKVVGTLDSFVGIGAGYPDYPWYFGTDGAYTAYPLVVSGQWDLAKEHMRGIRRVSRRLNGGTGKVIHEVVSDGSVFFGSNKHEGNTNETSQFATAVELIWNWTGDDAFRDEMYVFVEDGLRYVTSRLDRDRDRWPEGLGMVEREGMGSEKLDATAYHWQALTALENMARSKGEHNTAAWAASKAEDIEAGFEGAWWMKKHGLYADSLCNLGDGGEEGSNVCPTRNGKLQQRHWINVTPMEVGLAPSNRASRALNVLESGDVTGRCGLFHTGAGGGPTKEGELSCWTLPGSAMAVGEANYGRVGVKGAQFYMRSISKQLDLEMPGALPEIAPSPDYDPFGPMHERAMFMQAWSSYGVQWPVIHHLLGIRPHAPNQRVTVVPDVPGQWPQLSVENLAVGDASIAVTASHDDETYTTTVAAPEEWSLIIGHALPKLAAIESVELDGAPAEYTVADTERGREVRVESIGGAHELVVETN